MVAYDLLMVLMGVVLGYAIALPLIFFGYKLTISAKKESSTGIDELRKEAIFLSNELFAMEMRLRDQLLNIENKMKNGKN